MSGKSKLLLIVLAILCVSVSLCAAEDQWAEIQKAGVIRFGVAPDYIPFVYTEGTSVEGLDVALVTEMGRRLGVAVEPVNMAFDGLIDAVVIRQVDLIGGGFSVTEARKAEVDYTNPYYQAGGILVCRRDEQVTEETIHTARVGVMKGTSFEQWVASNLLMEGKVSPVNVYTYAKIQDVMDALKDKTIDVALVDEDVYRAKYRLDSNLVSVGDKFTNEKYAFAAVKGSTLIPQLNTVMREMFLDGTAQKIADEYFSKDYSGMIQPSITRMSQLDESMLVVRPADMPESREVTVEEILADNAPTCRNGMMFISDVSMPDRTVLLPSMRATKTWNIKNTGTCTWDTTYSFNYVKGSVFGPTTVKIDKLVPPNETYEVSVPIDTPAANGEYTAWWQMRSGAGTGFGETVWYDFIVDAEKGSSDQKVSQGTPKILKWYPDFYSTDSGKCPKIYYAVTDAYQVEFYIDNQLQFTSHNLSGYTSLCPKKMGIYTFGIRAVGETAISTAFQFVDETHYPNKKIGVNP